MDMSELAELSGKPASDGKGEIRTVTATKSYMRMPLFAALTKSDKPWVLFDLARIGEDQGIDLSSLMTSNSGDPTHALEQLRAASGPVEVIGSEKVRGVPTAHYRATIDLERLPQIVPADQRESARRSVEQLKKIGGASKVKTDVWISQTDKRVHRVKSAFKQNVQGQRMEMKTTVDLYDFGVKVPPVEEPPADQVFDLADAAAADGGTP
jgi:hypothetical protein